MKKEVFFAKHLPVEGEFKKGDIVIDHEGDVGIISNMSDLENIEVKFESGSGLFCIHKDCKGTVDQLNLAKLFLCSEEVFEKDRFRIKRTSGKILINDYLCTRTEGMQDRGSMIAYEKENQTFLISEEFCIKVVGEILTPGIESGKTFKLKETKYLTIK